MWIYPKILVFHKYLLKTLAPPSPIWVELNLKYNSSPLLSFKITQNPMWMRFKACNSARVHFHLHPKRYTYDTMMLETSRGGWRERRKAGRSTKQSGYTMDTLQLLQIQYGPIWPPCRLPSLSLSLFPSRIRSHFDTLDSRIMSNSFYIFAQMY